tara:strand:+ start:999 stop:1655 length:657 start_codon:yes stop_codon:yes gene_type:complete
MAFKMTGKSPMMKALIGKQGNLPPELKAKIEAAPESATKMRKASPAKMKEKAGKKKESGTERFDKMMVAAEEKATGKNPDAKPSKTAGRKSPLKLSEEDKKKEVVSRGQTSSTSETRNLLQNLKNYGTQEEKDRMFEKSGASVAESAQGDSRYTNATSRQVASDARARAKTAQAKEAGANKRAAAKAKAAEKKANAAKRNAMTDAEKRKADRAKKKNK